MRPTINLNLLEYIYYVLCFFYVSTAISLSLIKWNLEKLGFNKLTVKVIVYFLVFLFLLNLFFPSLTFSFLIPLFVSSVLFILSEKKTHFQDGYFMYFVDPTWQDILIFGKNWFKFGLIGAFIGLIIAIIQVQILQGGVGGFFTLSDKCVELGANGTGCLLSVPSSQIIGDHLAYVIGLYAGQAFIWTGLIVAFIKDNGKILGRLGIGGTGEKSKWTKKIDDFRKSHYI